MKKAFKLTGFILAGLLVLIIIAGIGGWLWLRSALPDYDGKQTVSGLQSEVTIYRDEHGIPTIIADNSADAAFALGYSHAQDRLWQMDFQRRAIKGQLAEILGEVAIGKDRWYRTLGLHHLAYQDYQTLPPAMKEELQAYTKGVNAYIENHEGAWPIEFHLLDYRPEPWQPEDCLLWGRYVGYDLSWNWLNEILKMRLRVALPQEKVHDFFPDYPQDSPTIFHDDSVILSKAFWDRLWQVAPPEIRKRQAASNAWVVDGKHSQSGSPLLANDPHLDFQIPGVWYLASIITPEKQVSGATIPFLPLMILGHNNHVAWGFTSAESDTADLFVEKIIVDDKQQQYYSTSEGSMPFETRAETIKVKGQEPLTIQVRHTKHGPVISDADPELAAAAGSDYVVALQATFLLKDNPTSYALYQMNKAQDSLSFFKALTSFVIPHQNILFATKDGTINFSSAGIVPLRRNNDGTMPSPGWEENSEWIGFVPLAAMPQWQNASQNKIVNANHRLVDTSFPYYLGRDWELPYRAERIEHLLQQQDKWDLKGFAKIQNDAFSGQAADLKNVFLTLLDDSRQHPLIQKLYDWDLIMDHTRVEPLIFTAWLYFIERNLLINVIGEDLFNDLQPISPYFIKNALASASWCELASPGRSCKDLVQQSWDEAIALLRGKLGDHITAWRWGDFHRFYMDHPILRKLPYIHDYLTPSFPVDGDNATVNRASPTMVGTGDRIFSDYKIPGYRGLFDLKELSQSQFVVSTGQSGHFLSRHYDDLTALWAKGQYVTLSGSQEDAKQKAKHTLILKSH